MFLTRHLGDLQYAALEIVDVAPRLGDQAQIKLCSTNGVCDPFCRVIPKEFMETMEDILTYELAGIHAQAFPEWVFNSS